MNTMKKYSHYYCLCLIASLFFSELAKAAPKKTKQAQATAEAPEKSPFPVGITKVEEYNSQLPVWGTTWKPASGATNGYHPTFYTGFAIRSQFPNRIHIRQARGNQTRLSIVLDDQTVKDYIFDLVKRYDFYKKMQETGRITPIPETNGIPHLRFFYEIIESPVYEVLKFVRKVQSGESVSDEEIYSKSLSTLAALNPGRVFPLKLNLAVEFAKWKAFVVANMGGDPATYLANDENFILSINSLLWGRVNLIEAPSAELKKKTIETALLALAPDNEAYVQAAASLLKLATGPKYAMKTLVAGVFQEAIQCRSSADCTLSYPEFTTIYPTGTWRASTQDENKNSINNFASPGLWDFYGPDRISMDKPYYGWIPKMYYEQIGNAFHNPGIKFSGIDSATKETFGAQPNHQILWAVKRGAVSHGCSRLASGHSWEFRHIFPVEHELTKKVHVFIHRPQDFDVYDVNGDGSLEIMGVDYLISYGYKDSYESREAAGLELGDSKRLDFYTKLYGSKNIFTQNSNGAFVFSNPQVSLPSYLDFKKKSVAVRPKISGDFPLYEQAYEKDKIQFISQKPNEALLRLLGHVRGCAPSSDKKACGEASFDAEAKSVVGF